MLVLPSPSAGAGRWRLPLADLSAARLAEALLSPNRPAAVDSLAEWLRADPSLVAWCIQHPVFWSTANAPTIRQVAQWLLDEGLTALQWPLDELVSPLDGSACSEHAATLVESGVYAAEAGRTENDRLNDRNYLLNLLHNAAAWHGVASTNVGISLREMPPLAQQEAPQLPKWLAPNSTLDPSAVENKPARKQAAHKNAIAARKRFLAAGPLAPTFLPQLMARLARQQLLETTFDQTLETEKLEAMAEFAAGAGHEINNPLAIIAGRAQLFLRDESDPERRRDLAIINVQAMRVYEMIADMMLFARPPQPELAQVDLVAIIEQSTTELAPKAAERRIAIEHDLPPCPLVLAADATQLTVALRALLDNALNAIDSDGHVWITAKAVAEADNRVEIIVRDSGPGITPEVRRHVFDPYYSGRQAGRGLGMGLSKCWRIVTLHGGRIDVDSAPGQGATFRIVLPMIKNWKPDA